MAEMTRHSVSGFAWILEIWLGVPSHHKFRYVAFYTPMRQQASVLHPVTKDEPRQVLDLSNPHLEFIQCNCGGVGGIKCLEVIN